MLIKGKVYHISKDNNLKILTPKIPDTNTINYTDIDDKEKWSCSGFEDFTTPRVSFSLSIDGCVLGIQLNDDKFINNDPLIYYLYTNTKPFVGLTNKDINKQKLIFDSEITGEVWSLEELSVTLIGELKIYKEVIEEIKYIPLLPATPRGPYPPWYKHGNKLTTYLRKYDVTYY